ncbi:MAG: calcium/sodium antiporter [Pseudomonadota bacterium]
MLLAIFAVVASLAVLALSADKFVDGASAMAYKVGMSPLLVGLTVVSFGTSAPEILIAVMSAAGENPGIAIGNALGSNVANIALILGVASLIIPLPVASTVLRRELPLLLAAVLFSSALLLDLHLSVFDGIALIITLCLCLCWLIYQGKTAKDDIIADEYEEIMDQDSSFRTAMIITVLALLALLISSRILVWGAVEIARALHVSELMIGLSIVAVGTSLPELAATIACVMRKEYDLAIGNVVGSNLFNALAVLGVVAVLSPTDVDVMVRNRDVVVQIVLTIALLIFCIGLRGRDGRINRFEGLAFVTAFAGYQWLIYYQEAM